jgi:release factor glutamine methyltransferase
MGIKSILRNASFRIVHRFIVEPKIRRTDRIRLLGFELVVPHSVFHPSLYFSSKFFAEFLLSQDFKGLAVAEIGCGSGIQSLAVASRGAVVTAGDINPACVSATHENAGLNHLENSITVLQSDLFAAFPSGRKFDVVIVNPPYYPGDPKSMADRAFRGGESGQFLALFFDEIPQRLTDGGYVLMVTSTDGDFEKLPLFMEERGFTAGKIHQKEKLFEVLSILRIDRNHTN